MRERLRFHIEARMARLAAEGNELQRRKWALELKNLESDAVVRVLEELRFDPRCLETMAIYAAQKVRRLVHAHLGMGSIDPYTEAIITNAKTTSILSNKAQRASLTSAVKNVSDPLTVRRTGSDGTAQTQASSTRQALVALGAARVMGKGRFAKMELNMSHPLMRRYQ